MTLPNDFQRRPRDLRELSVGLLLLLFSIQAKCRCFKHNKKRGSRRRLSADKLSHPRWRPRRTPDNRPPVCLPRSLQERPGIPPDLSGTLRDPPRASFSHPSSLRTFKPLSLSKHLRLLASPDIGAFEPLSFQASKPAIPNPGPVECTKRLNDK